MEISGYLHRIDDIENHGFNYQSRFFYLKFYDSTGKMQYCKFRLSNGRIDLLDGFELGDEIKVIFELEGNEVKNDRNILTIFDRKEVYGIVGMKETKISELDSLNSLYELKEGEEDEPLMF